MPRARRALLLAFVALATTLGARGPEPEGARASQIVAVAAGDAHTCARSTGGGVFCWGANDARQVGNGTSSGPVLVPTAVPSLTGVSGIAAGDLHTCAVASGGARCWGDNFSGQLGDGTSGNTRPIPANVVGLSSGVAAVGAGVEHTCARTTEGGVRCWGGNFFGQLGTGSADANPHPTPTTVSGLSSGVTAIAVGGYHTCALTSQGAVLCWGRNDHGQLGDGSTMQRNAPAPVSGLAGGVTAIVAGRFHTCARLVSGGLKCWGRNSAGQLGDGTESNASAPVDVLDQPGGSPIGDIASVAASGLHTCAVTTAGAALCWGRNNFGQVGDNSTDQRNTPVPVSGLASGVAAVALGFEHTCAVSTDSTLRCWGKNSSGQLGVGAAPAQSLVPVVVPAGADDSDLDGCTDKREIGANVAQGGQRNPTFFWDFFDTPDPSAAPGPPGYQRDRVINIADIFRVAFRFGATGDPNDDPLSPAPNTGYHTGYDRTPPGAPNLIGPADGAIQIGDVLAVAAQFGHSCG